MERKGPSSSKSSEKQHSSKKNVEGTSRRRTESSKGKVYKRIQYCEESSSDELVNADKSRFKHTQLYSRATGGENSRKESPRILERPSYKSPEKQQSSKKNVEETSPRTKSSKGRAYKRINYCENSSEESVNDDTSRVHLYSRATGEDNRRREALGSLSYNIVSDSKDSSSNDLCIDVGEWDTKHNMTDADKFLKESPSSATLSERRDFSESEKVFPFLFGRKNAEEIRHSEGDEEHKKDGTEVENDVPAGKVRKELKKNNVDKVWEKYKGLMKQSKKKESSRSKIDDVEPGISSSFRYERKDAFKSIKPISHSGGDVEPKKDGTEIEDGACARNEPKLSKNDKAYKRINYCENSSEESVNDDTSRVHLYSRATGGDNRRKEALYSLSYNIVSDYIDSSSNDLCIDVVERDTKHNMPDADKFLRESPSSATLSDRQDLFESEKVFPFLYWGKNDEEIRHSEGDEEHKKDGTEIENGEFAGKVRKELNKNNVDKVWKKYKGLMKQSKKKESSRSKIDDVEPGISSSFHYERKDAFKSIKPISHSVGDVEPKKDGTEIEDGACARNVPKLLNNDNLKKEVDKCKFVKKLEENKELSRCKIDDAENADKKVPTSEGSNENIADLKFSLVTAENKGVLKGQSDPSNALKENRPRPSL